jgi:hypothetical protein
MKYALLLYRAPDENGPSGDTGNVTAYVRALREAGVLAGVEQLTAPEAATSVRMRAGQRLLTDGPFAETKEHLLGFFVVDVAGLDEALDWAARMPHCNTGVVEVRPVAEDAAWRIALE